MRTWCAWMATFILFISTAAAQVQVDLKKVCHVEDGRLIFTLDLRWSAPQRTEVARLFGLDSALVSDAYALKPVITSNGKVWKTLKIDLHRFELSMEAGKDESREETTEKIFLLDDQWIKRSSIAERESVSYGVNRFTRNILVQSGGRLRFFLPGQKNAKKVFISGSFNAWSTLQTPMQPCDSGWTVSMNLKPGKYSYKFIIDGKWTNDSYNKLRENDTYHGYNNIFFCYNYKFVLSGVPDAHKVLVTGSFNQWNESELRMIRFQGNWVLPLYLREGTHAYKFIVDGTWMTDPANKVTRPDGKGNRNSFMGIGDTLFFTLKGYSNAKKVIVSGNFNAWNQEELAMDKTSDGWQLPYVLAPGNYEYKFIVDGKWITDPSNTYKTGSGNSYLSVKPNYWFRLDQYPDAGKVIVTGSFNNWSTDGSRMEFHQGSWWFPVFLAPGKHTYKFIVDGKWMVDPANNLWENNEYGTNNSVLWIEP